ncbi:MAG: phytoene/squalene synthase family protein [Proteobacteria bacterium]|nr:phytoene/squalene synthase family protein [Pseudomonadota bacterium]
MLAQGSRSFGFAARFLTADQWDDAAAVYAFCRMVDDVADDETVPVSVRRASLAMIRSEVRGASVARPEVGGLLEVERRCALDRQAALALIDGCESDLGVVRVQNDAQLLGYCYRVASTVGLMMCGVLSVYDRDAKAFAIDLGIAMQLTNICRDVLEDAANGRVYLPESRLRAVGVAPDALCSGQASEVAVAKVVLDLLDLADTYYASALHGMRYLPIRARFAIIVASRVYRRIGLVLRRRGGNALLGRAVVPFSGKVIEACWAVGSFLRPSVLGIGPGQRHDARLHADLQGLPGAHRATGITDGSRGQFRAVFSTHQT